jgi:mono/diheme cytochrome c family protein
MCRYLLASAVLLAGAFVASGPVATAYGQQLKDEVKHVATCDGAELYTAYCRDCHGASGRGTGEAARLLSAPVPDITAIAARDGTFDTRRVTLLVVDHSQHHLMPDWHEILLFNYQMQTALADLATRNLVKHIERMQVATAAR